MGSCFRFVVSLTVLLWGWIASDIHAQDDLIAKAQNERELRRTRVVMAVSTPSDPMPARASFLRFRNTSNAIMFLLK